MKNPLGLVACSHFNCLYISDRSDRGFIHRVELPDTPITGWSLTGSPAGISTTGAHNLLVTLSNDNRLSEFTTYGELVREINLHESIDRPWHAIELLTGQLIVCHWGASQHRVCIVGSEGHIVRSYGSGVGSSQGQLDGPMCLVLDTSDHVLVADCNNNKVRIFSPSLNYLGDVTLGGHELRRPWRLHLDQLNSCMYVSDSEGHLSLIFNFSIFEYIQNTVTSGLCYY